MKHLIYLALAATCGLACGVLLQAAPPAPRPIVRGYSVFNDCGALVYAAGMDTGVRVIDPCDPDRRRVLVIPPGASAAWGDPIELEALIES